MAKKGSTPALEYLVKGLMTLQNVDECRSFLFDLCTESELLEMSRRLQAAKMLKSGMIYADIAEETGLSTATISRVNRCLKYTEKSGYDVVLDRLAQEERRR
ncbi:MAG: TrpR YerC/YecD [Ruminococcaceae bacterium]|nr:TrpR YerC/YecD [Oscillospiraceae bacterium]